MTRKTTPHLMYGTLALMVLPWIHGCTPEEPNELDKLGLVTVVVKDVTIRAWIADEFDERAKGLMFVTSEELAPRSTGEERGMLFVFQGDQTGGFWMRNTIIDLDIAFIREDGTIVHIYTMAALDERSYIPRAPYRYALEVRAGVFEREGVTEGDHVDIPETALKRAR